jgi:opacity protein-like surface antigen
MKIRHSLFAVLALAATPAFAFDMPPPVEAPEYTGTISNVDGWYIRGDLGYNASIESGKPSYRTFDFATGDTTTNAFDKARFSKDFTLNAGGGYQFNDFFRSDLTLDYFKTNFKGRGNWEVCNAAGDISCRYKEQDSTALSLLLNGYVDLGTYWGFTPYLGAGAGMSYVKWGDVNQYFSCAGGCGNAPEDDMLRHEGADSWRFTYALMAGTSYDLTDSLKLDFGYRFSQIEGGGMQKFNGYETALGAFGDKGKDKGFTRHEFRTGLRLTTW